MDQSAVARPLEELPNPLGPLFDYWNSLRGERPLPRRCEFDPADIPRLLPHLILAEVLRSGADGEVDDFRFRLIGTHVDARMNERYTGRRLSQIPGKQPGSKIWSTYNAVERNGQPKVIELGYVGPAERTMGTTELYLPLTRDESRVDFIVVGLRFA